MTTEGAVSPLKLPFRLIGPVPFRVAPLETAVEALCQASLSPASGLAVHFANAYSVAIADTDPHYAAVLADPESATFSDGVPITWVGRRAYPQVAASWQRVYGPDVMEGVLQRCADEELAISHYLLGGSPETLRALESAIARRWPRVKVVGAESPPFRPMTDKEQAEQEGRIRDSGATMVWVGLGTPKQDFAVAQLARRSPATFLAVGAAFDFLAGSKPQAPLWMQRSGTEWAFRLVKEPRRLARRYLWGNPRFLLAASRHPGLRRSRRTHQTPRH